MRLGTATYCNKMHVDEHRFWLLTNPQHHWLVSAMRINGFFLIDIWASTHDFGRVEYAQIHVYM